MLHFLFLFTLIAILLCVFLNKNNKNLIHFVGLIYSTIITLKSKVKNLFLNTIIQYKNLYIHTVEYYIIDRFYLIFPFVGFYSILYGEYKVLIIFIVLKLKDYILKLPYIQDKVNAILKDQDTISYHWRNDLDLVWVRRVSYFCVIFGFVGLLYTNFIYISSVSKSVFFYNSSDFVPIPNNNLYLCIIIFGLIIDFIGEVHIIYYRNFPVDGKAISTCIKCGQVVAAGVVAVNFVSIPMSYVPALEPTLVGNTFQKNFGRGYGFETGRDHLHHWSFQNFNGIKDKKVPMSQFLDDNKNYSMEKANAYIRQPQNLEWAKKNLSMGYCQNLGFPKDYFL